MSTDNDSFEEEESPRFLIIIALFALAAFLGAASLKIWLDDPEASFKLIHIIQSVLVEIGFALVIAIGISIGIEKRARFLHNKMVQKQIDVIKDNYFEATFRHDFDPAFLRTAKKLFKTPFYRKGYEITCTLSLLDDGKLKPSSILQVDVVSTFKMLNLSEETQTYYWSFFIEKPEIEEYHEKSKVTDLMIGEHILSETEINEADCCENDTEESKRYEYKVDIEGNTEVFFKISSTIYKYARDELFWSTLTPADSFRMTVTYPSELDMMGIPIAIDPEAKFSTFGNGPKTGVININRPLLPWHGARIWWKPLPEKPISEIRPNKLDITQA